jgi:hypothetical protein
MMPSDFTDVSIRDFFVADRTLVTLVEAVKRDDHGDTSVPRDVRYFLRFPIMVAALRSFFRST